MAINRGANLTSFIKAEQGQSGKPGFCKKQGAIMTNCKNIRVFPTLRLYWKVAMKQVAISPRNRGAADGSYRGILSAAVDYMVLPICVAPPHLRLTRNSCPPPPTRRQAVVHSTWRAIALACVFWRGWAATRIWYVNILHYFACSKWPLPRSSLSLNEVPATASYCQFTVMHIIG